MCLLVGGVQVHPSALGRVGYALTLTLTVPTVSRMPGLVSGYALTLTVTPF